MPEQLLNAQEIRTNVKQGALLGGCVCFILGILFMFLTLWSVIFYVPLFFAAFVLSIVAMAQRRVAGGVLLLLGTIIIPPIMLFAIPAFKAVKADEESRAKQAPVAPQAGSTESAQKPVVAQQTQETPKILSQPESSKPTIPEIHLGESVLIDEVKITFLGVRLSYIENKSIFGDSTRRSEKQYLIVDVFLENTSRGRIIYLQDIWKKTKIIDDFGNIEGTKFSGELFMPEPIVGSIWAAKMKPGESSYDMIIFDLPVNAAKQFTIESDPGFWKSIGEDRVNELSDSSFKARFTKEQIKKQ